MSVKRNPPPTPPFAKEGSKILYLVDEMLPVSYASTRPRLKLCCGQDCAVSNSCH